MAAGVVLGAGVAALVLARLGLDGPARLLAAAVLAVATVSAAGALVARGWTGPLRSRVCWLLLGTAALAHGTLALTGEVAGHGSAGWPHVVVGLLVCAGLWLLPAPDGGRQALLRTGLDALAAGFAFAVLAVEVLLPDGLMTAGGQPSLLLHPTVGFLLVTVAVGVVARARRPGGLAMPSLVLLAAGATGLAVTDVVTHHGVGEPLGLVLAACPMLLWALGATLRLDDAESDRATTWRERVAVLTPLAPVTAAAALLLGANVFGEPPTGVTLACAVLLAVTLTTGGVLARLDSLATERTMDSLVLKRTVSLRRPREVVPRAGAELVRRHHRRRRPGVGALPDPVGDPDPGA